MTSAHRPLSMPKIFLTACLCGMLGVLALCAWSRYRSTPAPIATHRLTRDIDVSAQLPLTAISQLPSHGYTAVIDLRPDGEVPDQPSSSQVQEAARAAGLAFHYVPVPHGEIPESAVIALRSALAGHRGSVLLYCHSGKRAARTWSLVEAEQSGGLSTEQIVAAVQAAGQDAQDLRGRIDASIAARDTQKGL